ncbi:MAG: ATP-binding protein, partial [Actinomycetes bacterium]|nr:ATP-binding protein [Actinomycetes bacterium]
MTDSSLLQFVAEVAGEQALAVEEDLGAGFVRLNVSEAERRQARHDIRCSEDVLIELLRNARDAAARRLFVATATETREAETGQGQVARRGLTVIDDGTGIPTSMMTRVFEPRVTSKLETMRTDRWGVHGRGMALYSIAANALSAAVVASGMGRGAAVRVELDCDAPGERADQSSWPKIRRNTGETEVGAETGTGTQTGTSFV